MVIIAAMFLRIMRGLELAVALLLLAAVSGYSNPSLTNPVEKIRAYTRQIEFNYAAWMANAAVLKARAASVHLPHTLDRGTQKQIVGEYLRTTQFILEKERLLTQIYANPQVEDKEAASESTRAELRELYARQNQIAPLAEAVLQEQVAQVVAELGLTALGQPVPNVWYHATPLPVALIVSPRDRITQTANISLNTDITVDQMAALEARVDEGLNVSSLVVNIGGVGVYPTMIMRTTNLPWLVNTIAHEWIHNYLMFRPLGWFYDYSHESRTMNETTASIAGDEIGALVIERFYPELSPSPLADQHASPLNPERIPLPVKRPNPKDLPRPPFDFRHEMYITRVRVDKLLAEGKIEEAEAYMEERRQLFLQNGYLLRKINQAYFAFHGAYADQPGGAAGEDPIGPAVRALRAQSQSLAEFVNRISWMWTLEQLHKALEEK